MDNVARRLIIIIVATGAVSVVTGVMIGRYAIPDKGASPDTASVAPAPTSEAKPTTATPTLIPTPGPTSAPSEVVDGQSQVPGLPMRVNEFKIPVGYPHNEPGAVSACANYVAAYSDASNREPARIREVFKSITTEDSVAERVSQRLVEANNGTAKNFGVSSVNSPNFVLQYRVLGYKVVESKSDEAKIYIWLNANAGVTDGTPETKPRDFWGTDLCTVQWRGSDWKLFDANDGPDGPDPAEQRSEEFRRFLLIGAGA
ncbi:conserved hypothetical protein [Frankia canadensis]|uniref:Uncharacterized protein n=2 Tax=Frankia canadensis TaxID=1836972 RepID=A0A2I2L0F9_9ACTN|nr:conserved hypothetical protein [Frankia canadensis]SOU58685.1 conserved hypothetical protein [Frankia canadensis]